MWITLLDIAGNLCYTLITVEESTSPNKRKEVNTMYNLYRVNTTIRFIASFATYEELYAYCHRRANWISRLDKMDVLTISICEYPDGFESEVWYDEELEG